MKGTRPPANEISAIKLVKKSTTQWGMKRALESLNTSAIRTAYITMAGKYGDTEFYNNVLAASNFLPFAMMFAGNHLAVIHSVGLYHNLLDANNKNGL